MQTVELTMPQLGLIMENGRIVTWFKRPGDRVEAGAPLFEVETEKETIVVPAALSGTLRAILVAEGDTAAVGAPIALLAAAAAGDPGATGVATERLRISPAARRLAGGQGLDPRLLRGTGPQGRILLRDVAAALAARSTDAAQSPGAAETAPTPMRQAIARGMLLSQREIPQFQLCYEVDVTETEALRRRAADSGPPEGQPGVRLSLTDFIVQACALALQAVPQLNRQWVGDPQDPQARLRARPEIQIGLAIALPDGLVAPAIRGADQLPLWELARERTRLVAAAREGRIKAGPADIALTISNLGADGPDLFTSIINPSETAILSVGRIRRAPVASGEEIAIRSLVWLTLTLDHRVADGSTGVQFMREVCARFRTNAWHQAGAGA